jgi:aryl-alcohol dehydrogenase-like predicted oxidoreductase
MDIPAATIGNYDQRVAAVSDVLDTMIREFKESSEEDGETVAALSLAYLLSEHVEPSIIIDLFTVAILRLVHA